MGNFLILLLLLTFHQHLKCSSNLAHSLRHLVFFFFFSYFSKSEDGGIIVVCIKYCISGLSGQEKWKFKYLFLEEHSPQHFVSCGAGQQMGRVEKAVLASSGPTGARPLVTLEVSKRFVSFHWGWRNIYRDLRELAQWLRQELNKLGAPGMRSRNCPHLPYHGKQVKVSDSHSFPILCDPGGEWERKGGFNTSSCPLFPLSNGVLMNPSTSRDSVFIMSEFRDFPECFPPCSHQQLTWPTLEPSQRYLYCAQLRPLGTVTEGSRHR